MGAGPSQAQAPLQQVNSDPSCILMRQEMKVPHNYQAIIREAAKPSMGSLEDHMYKGIFLNNKRKKYWVDEKTGHNCFALFARDLLITWSEEPTYWHWLSTKESGDVEIEMAFLLNVCWLEVHGKLELSYLTPSVMYEIVFVLMMSNEACGWTAPVTLRVKFPDGRVHEHQERLQEKPRGQWINLKVCEFMTRREQGGEMEISLFECEDGQWKRGLIVKGVIICPKNYKLNN